MDSLRADFRKRVKELRSYVRMLRFVDMERARLVAATSDRRLALSQELFGVMKANVFLLLYNLVEATVTSALQATADAIRDNRVTYARLTDSWRRAWVKEIAKTSEPLGPEKRLAAALEVCDQVTRGLIIDFIPSISSGNLDDRRIEDMAKSFGVDLTIRARVKIEIKRHVLNELGALGLVRVKRNDLAHGMESFADCGRALSVEDLRRHTLVTVRYLEDVIASFDDFIVGRLYAARATATP